jgi:glutaredoxin
MLLILAAATLAGCKRETPEGTAPSARALPPLVLKDDTAELLLTYVDGRGDFHTMERISDIPPEYREAVRVVVTTREEGATTDLLYVADLRERSPDGTYKVASMSRAQWESLATRRRSPTAPPAGSPDRPPTAAPPAAGAVVLYGASWCGPCHDAQGFLKARGVPFVYHDIDLEEEARKEMNRKLDRAGMRKGTIPVLDVKGRMLVGFDPSALQQALKAAFGDRSALLPDPPHEAAFPTEYPGSAPHREVVSCLAMSDLPRVLAVLCDDLLFAVLAGDSLDESVWEELFKRRASTYQDALRGLFPPAQGADIAPWTLSLMKDAAVVGAPVWLPMHQLIDGGVTLCGGARGVRSLFSSKPSEKEVARVKRLGTLAFRALGSTLGADGSLSSDEQLQLAALLAALGLPTEEGALLAASPPGEMAMLEVHGEVEPKVAAQIFRGAWQAALRDGLDAREEGALGTLAAKLTLPPKDITALRAEAEQELEATRLRARSAIDAVYWLLGDDIAAARSTATAAASLLLPEPDRTAVLEAIAGGAPPASVQRTTLPRGARGAALAVAWLAALRSNPTQCRKAILAARFDPIARALEGDGPKVRATVEGAIDRQLIGLAAAPG